MLKVAKQWHSDIYGPNINWQYLCMTILRICGSTNSFKHTQGAMAESGSRIKYQLNYVNCANSHWHSSHWQSPDSVVDFGSRWLLQGRMRAMLLSRHTSRPHLIRQCMESLQIVQGTKSFKMVLQQPEIIILDTLTGLNTRRIMVSSSNIKHVYA